MAKDIIGYTKIGRAWNLGTAIADAIISLRGDRKDYVSREKVRDGLAKNLRGHCVSMEWAAGTRSSDIESSIRNFVSHELR